MYRGPRTDATFLLFLDADIYLFFFFSFFWFRFVGFFFLFLFCEVAIGAGVGVGVRESVVLVVITGCCFLYHFSAIDSVCFWLSLFRLFICFVLRDWYLVNSSFFNCLFGILVCILFMYLFLSSRKEQRPWIEKEVGPSFLYYIFFFM